MSKPSLHVSLVSLLVFALVAPAGAADVVFHEISHPSFVNYGPGDDGRLGTGDDNDFSALDLNGAGSASWIYASNLPFPIPGGGNELIQFSHGDGTLRFVGMPPLSEGGAVDVFAFRAIDDLSRNPLFDLPTRDPHAFQLYPGGSFLFAWTVRTCLTGDPSPDDCDTIVLENDVSGGGWVWPVDTDPRDLPSIDTFPVPGLPEYMEFLATLVPAETTMLSLAYIGPLTMTADNTRGETAFLSVGGDLVAFIGGYSTDPLPPSCPEPADLCGRTANLDWAEKLKVKGVGKSAASASLAIEFGAGTWVGRLDDGRRLAGTWKRSGPKKRQVKLKLSEGAPLVTLDAGAWALSEDVLGESAVAVPTPGKIVLELDRKSTTVLRSKASRKSKVAVGSKKRKASYVLSLSGEFAPME